MQDSRQQHDGYHILVLWITSSNTLKRVCQLLASCDLERKKKKKKKGLYWITLQHLFLFLNFTFLKRIKIVSNGLCSLQEDFQSIKRGPCFCLNLTKKLQSWKINSMLYRRRLSKETMKYHTAYSQNVVRYLYYFYESGKIVAFHTT